MAGRAGPTAEAFEHLGRGPTGRLSMLPHAESLASARHALDDLTMLARLTRDAPAFLRRGSPEQAVAWRRQRLAAREAWFPARRRAADLRFPRSPYLALLRAVGEPATCARWSGRRGWRAPWRTWRASACTSRTTSSSDGGRWSAAAGRFRFAEHDFDNPRAVAHYEVLSGGRGRRGRVPRSLSFIVETGYCAAPAFEAHGVRGPIRHSGRTRRSTICCASRCWASRWRPGSTARPVAGPPRRRYLVALDA